MINLFQFTHTAPDDYTATTEQLAFTSDNQQQCVDIPIVNDTRTEGAEQFFVRLSTSEVRVILDPLVTTVHIMDDDG